MSENWLKILSGPEETEFLLFPVAIVHFQVLAGITTWFLLVLFYLGFGYFLSVFFLESQHDSFSVQIVKSNVFSSQWISPWGKYFPKQFGLHITKEIKHKHLSTFPHYALMLRTVYLQIKIKCKHLRYDKDFIKTFWRPQITKATVWE